MAGGTQDGQQTAYASPNSICDRMRVPSDMAGNLATTEIHADYSAAASCPPTVSSIPVFLIFNGGKVVYQQLGITPEVTLRAEMDWLSDR